MCGWCISAPTAGFRIPKSPSLVNLAVAAPYTVNELLAREHSTPIFHHVQDKFELGWPETKVSVAALNPMRSSIKFNVTERQQIGNQIGSGAAQKRLHARQNFVDRERLHDIVVRSSRKSANAVCFLPARCQHKDRQIARLRALANPPAELNPAYLRQHPIEHDEIKSLLDQRFFSFRASHRTTNSVASGFEIVAKQLNQC